MTNWHSCGEALMSSQISDNIASQHVLRSRAWTNISDRWLDSRESFSTCRIDCRVHRAQREWLFWLKISRATQEFHHTHATCYNKSTTTTFFSWLLYFSFSRDRPIPFTMAMPCCAIVKFFVSFHFIHQNKSLSTVQHVTSTHRVEDWVSVLIYRFWSTRTVSKWL